MTKLTSSKLVLILITILLLSNSIFSTTVLADSRDLFSKENFVNLAKGVAAIYLLSRVSSLVTEVNDSQSTVINQKPVDSRVLSQMNGKVILLDPGHGGSDPGAVGPGGLKEKDVNLDIALQVYQLLKANTNARVYITRDSDRFVSLNQRTAMANNLAADTFISFHINGSENGSERGIETYAHYNSPKSAWALGWYIQDSLVKELGLIDRGLKADNFHVVRETNMDSVLLEIGFITDSTEESLLRQSSTRKRAATAVYNGILSYYSKL